MRILPLLLSLLLLGGCVSVKGVTPYLHIAPGNLPATDVTLNVAGLTSCTDNPDHSLHLKMGRPVYVLVHGCFGSSGQFRGLAQVLAFHGQQTVCFTYGDRARLARSAMDLHRAIEELSAKAQTQQITIIGHSQGALIARKSLTYLSQGPQAERPELRLVTISGPFGGIAAARTCGRHWLYPVTMGLLPLSCFAATGAKWQDITYSSQFIRQPGNLVSQVSRYLKIDTDERGTCRRSEGERCLEGDSVFSLAEQRSATVESDARARRVEVLAGHVEIVGDRRVSPTKLIAILQEQGAIPPTAPENLAAFNQLMARIYQESGYLKSRP